MQRMKFFAPRRRSPLLIIFLIVLIDLLGYGMMIPLLPFYAQRLGGDAFMVGLLGSLYAFMQLVSGPILGALGDRYGRRPILLASILGTALAYGMLGTANALAVLFLAIMLDGITGGNLSTAYAYIADVTAPETRARGMGLVGAAFGLGLMVGPALGGLLSVYGLRVPAIAACALAIGNVLLCWFWLPESLPLEKRARALRWRSLNWVAQLVALARLQAVRVLLAAIFLLNLAFAGLQTNFPLFSQARFGWTTAQNGIFFAFVGVCAVFVQGFLLGKMQPRFGDKRLALSGLVFMASALALVALAPEAWMLYPLVALGALGSGTSIPTLTGLISQRVAAEEQGRLMGGTQVVLNLAAIVGPTGAGVAFERVGAGAPYALGAAFAGLAFACAWYGLRVKSTRAVGPPHA
jgi:DHA1 family tetracycline resistance protein-like MFS transporter